MDLLRPILAIALVFGLLWGARWTLRRRGLLAPGAFSRNRKASGHLQVIERVALTPQHTLHLVRAGDRALLIGVHAGGCSLIESLSYEAVERARGFEAP